MQSAVKVKLLKQANPKIAFYAVSWHKQPNDNQTTQFLHQVSMQFGKLWQTQVFLAPSLGCQIFFFNLWLEVFETRESILGLTGWTSSSQIRKIIGQIICISDIKLMNLNISCWTKIINASALCLENSKPAKEVPE